MEEMSQRRYKEVAYPIEDQRLEENIRTSRGMASHRQRALEDYTTTNSYFDSLIMDGRLFRNKLFHILNRHAANALKYKILACIDPFSWHEIVAETVLAAATEGFQTDDKAWCFYKIQVKSSVDDTPAKVTAFMSEEQT